MNEKEQWVAAFQEAMGRNPSPREFMDGKAAGFSLDSLPASTPQAFDESVDRVEGGSKVENVESDGQAGAQTGRMPVEEAQTGRVDEPTGRIPTPQSATQAETTVLPPVTAAAVQTAPAPAVMPARIPPQNQAASASATATSATATKKKMPVWGKVLIAVFAFLVVAFIVFYFIGSQYFSRQSVVNRYIEASHQGPQAVLKYQVWADDNRGISPADLAYADQGKIQMPTQKEVFEGSAMRNVGHTLLIFPDWKVVVKPASATLKTNTSGLDLTINGHKVGTSQSSSYQKTFSHLYPGTYVFAASGKVNNQDINVSTSKDLTAGNQEIRLAVRYISFDVLSNLSDGDLYVGGQKVSTLSDGTGSVTKLPVAESADVYVRKSFADGTSVKTKTTKASDISDGETVYLNAAHILDRDTANDLMTKAHGMLQYYADNQTTASDLDDVFLGGTSNKFYSDVKNNIDLNMTNAKNRKADSITFSDVNVTKVTQTGKNTYKVDFTLKEDFYYSYNSDDDNSGDIIENLTWSANVKYVGGSSSDDENGTAYVSDFRVVSPNGNGKVTHTENTIE